MLALIWPGIWLALVLILYLVLHLALYLALHLVLAGSGWLCIWVGICIGLLWVSGWLYLAGLGILALALAGS